MIEKRAHGLQTSFACACVVLLDLDDGAWRRRQFAELKG